MSTTHQRREIGNRKMGRSIEQICGTPQGHAGKTFERNCSHLSGPLALLLLLAVVAVISVGTPAAAQTPEKQKTAGQPPQETQPAQQSEQTPEQLLQQADDALKKNDHVAAAQILETYLAKKPEDYRAEFNLAYAYSLTGRRAEAMARYRNVLQAQPDLAMAHLNLGILLMEDLNPGEAESHLRAVLKQQPDNVSANKDLADVLVALKRFPEAGDAYEKVLKLQPENARAHLAYAKIIQESNPAAAEEHLRHAVRIDPESEEAWITMADLLESQGAQNPAKRNEAAEVYLQYLEKHPRRGDLRARLGDLFAAQKKFAAAAEQYEIARASGDIRIDLAKQLLQAYVNLSAGSEAERRQQPEEREKLLDRLNNPGKPNVTAQAAREREEQDKLEEKSLALVREILVREPEDAEMQLLYGRLLMDRKEYREAASVFYRAAKLQPLLVF